MSSNTAAAPSGSAQKHVLLPIPPLPTGWRSLPHAFIRQARSGAKRPAIRDSTGADLTYGETFIRAAVMSRVLARLLGPEPYVGLFLPPTVPSALANLAILLLGKIPVNLNYTATQELVDSSIDQCGIKHVLTSRKVLDRFKLTPKGTLIHLEDIPKLVRPADKAWGYAAARFVPIAALPAFFPGLRGNRLDTTATIIFTSGSTGDPKGVVLSHRNVLSNVHQMDLHVDILPDESVLGVLPFFHSMGFTVCIWTILCLGKRIVYHFNPLDAKIVGTLCERFEVTMIVATPTFMRAYLQRCQPSQFSKLVHLLLGAEKLKPEFASEIREKLSIEPMEGYGCTELSPVVAVNVGVDKTLPDGKVVRASRAGTVGLPVPGTAIRIVDPETGEELPVGTAGMILVAGPQVMQGYFNKPEATAKVLQDGWYTTGDLGLLDEDGFLKITDRLSRFSKIGGEMVPHVAIESAIQEMTGTTDEQVAVTSVPDAKRGERLCVIYTGLTMPIDELCRRLATERLPRLWVPAPEDFIVAPAIPVLGSGKIDLRGVRKLALERAPK